MVDLCIEQSMIVQCDHATPEAPTWLLDKVVHVA